jgi:hypothetical protein
MKTVTLQVATLNEVKRRAQDAFKGKKQGSRISFATPELLFRLMTDNDTKESLRTRDVSMIS